MSTRQVTKKVRVVETDNTKYYYKCDSTHAGTNKKLYFMFNNTNYYFTTTIAEYDVLTFIPSTQKLYDKNQNEITTSQTALSGAVLIEMLPSHKWSDSYIDIGAKAENVFLDNNNQVTLVDKLAEIDNKFVQKTGDTMTGALTISNAVNNSLGLSDGATTAFMSYNSTNDCIEFRIE